MSSVAVAAAVFLALVGVGLIDLRTGEYVMFSPLYLVPIAAAAWWLHPRITALAVAVSVVSGSYNEAVWPTDFPFAVTVWNAIARATVFGGVAVLITYVRRHNDGLIQARDHLAVALEKEHALSRTDGLTGLANRRCFIEALSATVERRAGELAVAYLDLDDFKAVNDRHGHAAGDALLRRLAQDIQHAVRDGDLPARLGGDEFAVLFHRANPAVVHGVLERLLRLATEASGHLPDTSVGLSIGVVYFREAPARVEDLLHQADRAMYRAKRSGKGRIVVEHAKDRVTEAASVRAPRESAQS